MNLKITDESELSICIGLPPLHCIMFIFVPNIPYIAFFIINSLKLSYLPEYKIIQVKKKILSAY